VLLVGRVSGLSNLSHLELPFDRALPLHHSAGGTRPPYSRFSMSPFGRVSLPHSAAYMQYVNLQPYCAVPFPRFQSLRCLVTFNRPRHASESAFTCAASSVASYGSSVIFSSHLLSGCSKAFKCRLRVRCLFEWARPKLPLQFQRSAARAAVNGHQHLVGSASSNGRINFTTCSHSHRTQSVHPVRSITSPPSRPGTAF
jgi:hypothetical protein